MSERMNGMNGKQSQFRGSNSPNIYYVAYLRLVMTPMTMDGVYVCLYVCVRVRLCACGYAYAVG